MQTAKLINNESTIIISFDLIHIVCQSGSINMMLYLWIKRTKQLIDCSSSNMLDKRKMSIFGKSYIILLLTCSYLVKKNENRWKLPPTHPLDIVICGGSVDYGLMTSCKHVLWWHFDHMFSEGFLGLECWPLALYHSCQVGYHSLIIELDLWCLTG